ncbi:MAG: acetate--CoA ligase family protein [Candidatus Jordarchaeum sp.]|uniref:acetate--CoA ligase family protein n=1 Tax=Candidatus Jordarchaeum sp. TaxID=2823881 RepID=UPI00404A9875
MIAKPFFEANSVIIVGASPNEDKLGFNILKNYYNSNYRGRVYCVNPNHHGAEALGYKFYGRIADVPDSPELGIIIIPASHTPEALRELGQQGVKHVIIESGGFGEMGTEEGKRLQEEIIKIASEHNIRIIGPNCVGTSNSSNGLINTFCRIDKAKPGSMALVTQGGIFGGATLEKLVHTWSFSKIATLGNKLDINETDILEYLIEDPQTKAIGLYLEDIKDGKRFIQVARKATKHKPLVVLKGGVTEAGTRATASHTGAIAGREEVFDAAVKQSGLIKANNLEELFDFTKAFAFQPLPKGKRIEVISNSGTLAVLATDTCVKLGLQVPILSDDVQKKILEKAPSWLPSAKGPLDLGPADWLFEICIEEVLRDPTIDGAVVCVALWSVMYDREDFIVDVLRRTIGKYNKPVLVAATGHLELEKQIHELEKEGLPVYDTPERAAKAIAAMYKYYTRIENK